LALESSVALVTGAARGIGRQVALVLADRGYVVAANDLDATEDTLEELQRSGAEALSVTGDVSDEGAVRGIVEAVMGRFGRINVLANNAGISLIVPAEETALSNWRRVLEVNLTGSFLMSRESGKEMIRQSSGSIVNISLVAGLLG
jgi:NAD(P)-dependent dehydrogenase (short-subunit alcohol dehydrogenase family)